MEKYGRHAHNVPAAGYVGYPDSGAGISSAASGALLQAKAPYAGHGRYAAWLLSLGRRLGSGDKLRDLRISERGYISVSPLRGRPNGDSLGRDGGDFLDLQRGNQK